MECFLDRWKYDYGLVVLKQLPRKVMCFMSTKRPYFHELNMRQHSCQIIHVCRVLLQRCYIPRYAYVASPWKRGKIGQTQRRQILGKKMTTVHPDDEFISNNLILKLDFLLKTRHFYTCQ